MACNDNSNCADPCGQIDKLLESANALVEYRDILEKWLNGRQDEKVQIGGEVVKTLLGLIADIKQLVGVLPDGRTIILDDKEKVLSVLLAEGGGIKVKAEGGLYVDVNDILVLGGGLAKDEDGKIYVDFSQMPTDKFEALLKQIRVPIWLTAHKDFYVNGETGSDTLDDGRGESEEKPFKTINACISYICENFNIVNFIVTINLSEGTFNETENKIIILQKFSCTTGRINIVGAGKDKTIVKVRNKSLFLLESSNTYHIKNMTLIVDHDDVSIFTSKVISCSNSGAISVSNCKLVTNSSIKATYQIYAFNYGEISISECDFEINKGYILYSSNAYISITGNCTMNGSCAVVASAIFGGILYKNRTNPPVITGSVVGKRYDSRYAGIISTSSGPEYFPGTEEGTTGTNGLYD